MRKYLIYALLESDGSEVKYVGLSRSGERRAHEHLQPNIYNKKKTPVYYWIRNRVNQGKKPIVRIIEETTKEELSERERYWIEHYKAQGMNLKNVAPGGYGGDNVVSSKAVIDNFGNRYRNSTEAADILGLPARMVRENAGGRSGLVQNKYSFIYEEDVGKRKHHTAEELRDLREARRIKKKLEKEANKILLPPVKEPRERKAPSSIGKKAIYDQFGNKYESINQAAKKLGITANTITKVLAGSMIQSHGYIFKREQDLTTDFFTYKFVESTRPSSRQIVDDRGNIYNSINHAATTLNASCSCILLNLQGKRKTAAGRIFKYLEGEAK